MSDSKVVSVRIDERLLDTIRAQGEITRAIIGHESEEMTEHYLHLRTGDMEAVMAVQSEIKRVVG